MVIVTASLAMALLMPPYKPRPQIAKVTEISDCNSPEQVRWMYSIVYPPSDGGLVKTVLALELCDGEVSYMGYTTPDLRFSVSGVAVNTIAAQPSTFGNLEKSNHAIAVSE